MSTPTTAFDNELNSGLLAALDLASHVYVLDQPSDKQSPPPSGWEPYKTFGMELQFLDSAIVDSACIYINQQLREACYVCRGSHTLVDWVVVDGAFVAPEFFLKFTTISLIPRELPRVSNAAQNIREMVDDPALAGYSKFLVGHSLGGYVVKAACIYHGLRLPVVSLNGPGWFDFPIIGHEQGNILEITNSADIVGNYRNKCANEIYVNTGDDLNQRSFWGIINPVVGTAEMAGHFANAHRLAHIRDRLAAVASASEAQDIALSLFNGLSNAKLKRLFADRTTFWGVRLADTDISHADGTESAAIAGTQVGHAILLHEGRIALATSVELAGAAARQQQLRYSDGSGHSVLASTDPGEGRTITFPVTADDSGQPRIGAGTVSTTQSRLHTAATTTRENSMNIREQIWLLHGAGFDPLPQTFNAAFALFIQMRSEANAIFFAKACAATGPESGETLALMFGEWFDDPAALQAGDLVFFNSAFVSDGESWGILAERMTDGAHKVLYPNKTTYRGEYLRDVPVTLVRGWRPRYSQALDEQSPAGQFWGPLMSKLRGYIEVCDGAIDEDALLRAIAARTERRYESIGDFARQHGEALAPVADATRLPAGSVVLTADQQGIGVYLSDQRVLGVRQHGETPKRWPLARFGAGTFWEPR